MTSPLSLVTCLRLRLTTFTGNKAIRIDCLFMRSRSAYSPNRLLWLGFTFWFNIAGLRLRLSSGMQE